MTSTSGAAAVFAAAALAVGAMAVAWVKAGGKVVDRVPVTVLSGFLGAGKTTVLTNLLTNSGALRIGVVVNDLAEVNVDARLVQELGTGASVAEFAELQNGCVCCTGGNDMLKAIGTVLDHAYSQGSGLDHIVIECSGVAQPHNIVELFAAAEEAKHAILQRCFLSSLVTVVDAGTVSSWLQAGGTLQGSGEMGEEMPMVQLLVEQVEVATLLVLNKADKITSTDLAACKAALKLLNSNAEVVGAKFGVVPLEVLLGSGRRRANGGSVPKRSLLEEASFSGRSDGHSAVNGVEDQARSSSSHHKHPLHVDISSAGHQSPGSLQVASFVYRSRRPFHPKRLAALLRSARSVSSSRQPLAGTSTELSESEEVGKVLVTGVLRAKGLVWLATNMEKAREWSQAGGALEVQHGQKWWAACKPEEWPASKEGVIRGDLHVYEHGDRRQEVIFIGTPTMDKGAIEAALQNCLLSDAEMALGPSQWRAFPDSVAVSLTPSQRAKATLKTSHPLACPCCDPDLKALDQLVFGGRL